MQPEKEYIKQLNEMATIGSCEGKRIVTNSLDHGLPHIHYGKVKIYLPSELPKNQMELKSCVDASHVNRITDKELTRLISWFEQKNSKQPKLTNFEAAWLAWHLEHPEEQERK